MVATFLDPKNDVAFKKIFGTEKNKDILIRFLNDVITFKERSPILDVTFIKTTQDPETAAQKTSIVDILCTDEKGHQYIVEMQVAKTKGFEKRAQLYASKAYGSQAHVGDQYHDLKEIIFLAIVDYDIFPQKTRCKSDHIILDKETFEHDLKDFSFTFISLPKFNKTFEELDTLEERWCYFLKYAETTSPEDLEKIIAMGGILKKAYHELDKFYWTAQELNDYDKAEKARKDYLASLAQKLDEGIAIGVAIGKEEGISIGEAKGIAIGEAKGRSEEKAKAELEKTLMTKEMARSLYKQGVLVSLIAKITKLSIEEIESTSC